MNTTGNENPGNILMKEIKGTLNSTFKILDEMDTEKPFFSKKSPKKGYLNLAICDYLAIAHELTLKQKLIKTSRKQDAYVSDSNKISNINIHEEAEQYLSKIFCKPLVVFQRISEAHVQTLAALIDRNDAVILDQFVNTSIRLFADILKKQGNRVEILKHNRMDILEDKIKTLRNKYHKIWYLTDGIYSLFGDALLCKEAINLLNQYEQLYLYVDDSNGLSWNGENGKGFVLNNINFHSRIVLTASLCKGFGAEGGVAVFNDNETKFKVLTSPELFHNSSTLSPVVLNSIIESTKIHLSAEIYKKQVDLKSKILLFIDQAKEHQLPLINNFESPIFYLATGSIELGSEICNNLMKRGYYTNISLYPRVPINNAGIKICLNLSISDAEIVKLVEAIHEEIERALKKRDISVSDILKYFKTEKAEVYS
jgi:7-keto-8-aminopelargonate synthetase-like enzyme